MGMAMGIPNGRKSLSGAYNNLSITHTHELLYSDIFSHLVCYLHARW